jgi:hypothetical protein
VRASLVAGTLFLLAASARAAPPAGETALQQTLAEKLFTDGKALMTAGRLDEACPKFAESQRLDPRAGTLLNLAVCHEEQGKVATAWMEYHEAANLSLQAGRADRADFARQSATALEGKMPYVDLDVRSPPPGLDLTLDGVALKSVVWNSAIPIDPGEHTLRAAAPGRTEVVTRWTIPAGSAHHKIVVPALAIAPPLATAGPAPSPPAAAPVQQPARAEASASRWPAYVAAGGSLAAVVVGTYFGLHTFADVRDVKDGAHCNGKICDQTGLHLEGDAQSSATVSTVAFVVGAGLAGVATYLFVTRKDPPRGAARLPITPLVSPVGRGASLLVEGRF